jgi:hypothetical protein
MSVGRHDLLAGYETYCIASGPPLYNSTFVQQLFGSIQRNFLSFYGGNYGNDAESQNDEFQRFAFYGNLSGNPLYILGFEYNFFHNPEISGSAD